MCDEVDLDESIAKLRSRVCAPISELVRVSPKRTAATSLLTDQDRTASDTRLHLSFHNAATDSDRYGWKSEPSIVPRPKVK
jgi:hypothetical protein